MQKDLLEKIQAIFRQQFVEAYPKFPDVYFHLLSDIHQ